MKRACVFGLAMVWLVGVVLVNVREGRTAPQRQKKRAASVHQLMEGFVSVNCGALKKALDAEKTNWKQVQLRAALLNEAGFILLEDGRCPDATWAKAARALQTHSVEVIEAAKKQDKDAALAAFKNLTSNGCATCHKVHRKKHD
ncbi:MAG: hypothetical protein D6725_15395 [Planctomycetota bacterium]|nr:MAG: hypothetical protein D6725_15395 [Planctomycetota bacterium]